MNLNLGYKITCVVMLATCFYCSLSAQNKTNISAKGEVNVIAEPEFHSILNKKLTYDVYNSGYNGHRVQIYFDSGNNSKQRAYDIAEVFYKRYPDIPAYITFKEPYYRVRVGNFRTRLDADKLMSDLIRYFSGAFVVKEFISVFDEPYSASTSEPDPTLDIPGFYDSESIQEETFR